MKEDFFLSFSPERVKRKKDFTYNKIIYKKVDVVCCSLWISRTQFHQQVFHKRVNKTRGKTPEKRGGATRFHDASRKTAAKNDRRFIPVLIQKRFFLPTSA